MTCVFSIAYWIVSSLSIKRPEIYGEWNAVQRFLLPSRAPHLYNLAHYRINSTSLDTPKTLAIIAGNGVYPQAMARAARAAGVSRLAVAAFQNETDPALTSLVDEV